MPLIPAVASGVAGNLLTKAIGAVTQWVTLDRWEQADDRTRLFWLLEGAYGDELPSFTRDELARTWGSNAAFVEVYERLSGGADPERERRALVAAIEPLVGATESETPRHLAERIAAFLPYLLPQTKQGDTRVLYELRQVRNLMEAQGEAVTARLERIETGVSSRSAMVILSSDWPSAPEDALRRASAADGPGLANLNEALRDKDEVVELPRLMRNPRAWMTALSSQAWELIAVMSEENGLWEESQQAWLAARERPGADFAGCSVRAAEAAIGVGDGACAVALLEEARAHDPSHPRVALQDALTEEDSETALAALSAIEGADTATAAMVDIVKARVHLALRDTKRAHESLAAARQLGAKKTASYRLTETAVALAEMLAEAHPSAQRADEIADKSLGLEAQLLSRRQPSQAGEARTQASAGYMLVGDYDTARRILADAVELYADQPADPRLTVSMAAGQLESFDVVEALVRPEDANARAQYLRAMGGAHGGEHERTSAAAELDGLLGSEHEHIRDLAAMELLLLAGTAPDIDWNQKAEAVVTAKDSRTAVALKAFWFERTGNPAEAERELLRHSDEAWALRELMRVSGRATEWEKAAGYADALLRGETDWASYLSAAEAFHLSGDQERAMTEFGKLANNQDAPVAIRAAAYRRLVAPAVNGRDYGEVLRLVRPWLELQPNDADAGWVEAVALAMLGFDQDALAGIEQRGLHPRRPDEFRIAAQLYISAGEPVAALRKVVEFAEQQNPPSEQMETFVISAALRAGSRIPEELRERVSVQRFVELFPDSEHLEARSIEDLKEFIDGLADRAQRVKTVEDQVYDAYDTPTAVLAVITGNDVGSLWMRMSVGRGLPMGYSNWELDLLERQDARDAIGGPVLWDATGIFAVDHVLNTHSDTIRTAFPNANITQAALADMAESLRRLQLAPDGPVRERKELGYNLQEGKAEFYDISAEAVEAEAQRARRALDFAQKLNAVPNADSAHPQPEDEQLDLVENSAFRGMVATFGTARRLNLPIYSDDREIRRRARAFGLRAFGTVAALDSLTERRLIELDERVAARRTLLRTKALGVHSSGDELILLAREATWSLTLELGVAALDPGQWREQIPVTLLTWTQFFYAVYREAPDYLMPWVFRILDALKQTRPEIPIAVQARHLFAMSLISYEPDAVGFSRALLRALHRTREFFAQPIGDVALAGLSGVIQIVRRPAYGERGAALATRAWLMLPLADQPRALALLLV
jgi:tetratricopeptide (TPR) repeat protein